MASNKCVKMPNVGFSILSQLDTATSALIPDICRFFLHEQNFWRIKFTPKKTRKLRQNTQKIAIFCVITAKYTVNCQFFALNL